MDDVLREIAVLRRGAPFVIDARNSNRYRVVSTEPDGSRTAYYFSTPIYNSRTRRAVDMRFHFRDGVASATGSNATVTVADSIRMENAEGVCMLSLSGTTHPLSEHEVLSGRERISLTTNGVAVRSTCRGDTPYRFSLEISKPFLEVRANDRCFVLMSEKFRPFVSVSCIGTADADGSIVAPAKLTYERCSDRRYILTVTPTSPLGVAVMTEANLYEPKLLQDTTVESRNPKTNNAFGSIGFIGTTKEYGEQWLYARPDGSKMTEMQNKKILRAILHIPRWNHSAVELSACGVTERFCSFGSTWNNKIAADVPFATPKITDRYVDLDLTSVLASPRGRWLPGEGFILRARKKDAGFAVVATGDHYLTPQILEIHYR